MDFEKICMMFTMQEPYYGILLSAMNRVEDRAISTIAVGKKGNVFQLHYNPGFIGQFSIDTVLELLKHEVMHLAFSHFSLFPSNPENATEHKLRNVAMDLEVNCYLDRSKMDKSVGGVWCEDFGFEKELGTREYYKLLQQKDEEQQEQQQKENQDDEIKQEQNGLSGDSDSDSGESDDPKDSADDENHNVQNDPETEDDFAKSLSTFDSHEDWPDDMTESEAEQISQQIDDLLEMAAEECIKSTGSLPAEMKKRIDDIKNRKRVLPVADWRRYMRRYLGNEFTEIHRKSRKRPSKRFPDAMGNRHQRKSNVLVAIDTSGSIDMPEYNEFFTQIKTLAEKASFHVVECDTQICHEYDFNGIVPQNVHGGGGTAFNEPVNLFLQNKDKYDALVYFTDGYGDVPKNTPKDTLWVISSNGNKDRKKYTVNGASVVFIPKK